MSAAVDTSHPPNQPSSDAASDQRASGFTAVNGRSPPHAMANGHEDRVAHDPPPASSKGEMESESEKRKRNEGSPNSQSSADLSPKRQRLSPAHSEAPTIPGNPPYASDRKPGSGPSAGANESNNWPDRAHNEGAPSETHLADALKTDMSGQSLHHQQQQQQQQQGPPPPSGHPKVEQGYQGRPQQPSPYHVGMESGLNHTPLHHRQQQGQGGRKRNFSNRTKTGCLTCRERKKKCDERKPFCSNCERGNFHCRGYTQTSGATYKSAVPVQPTLQPQPHPQHYPPYPHSAAPYYEQMQSHQPRPIQEAHPASAYHAHAPPPQWPAPQPPHYPPEAMHQGNYQAIAAQPQVPSQPISSFPDPSRHPQSMPPPPQPVHPAHNRTNSQPYPYHSAAPAPTPNGQSIPANEQQRMTTQAQMALNHSSSHSPGHSASLTPSGRTPKTEKEKMIAGIAFQPNDAELKADREICFKRVHLFNKAAMDPDDRSDSRMREKLQAVLESPSDTSPGGSANKKSATRLSGHLGKNVEVQAPFHCEYGYNISIGDDVDIRRGCHIMDECSVEIGPRTIIGPDVKILTVDGAHDNQRIRSSQKRLLIAKKVTIGADVFIGAGAIILPGRTIGDGATIGAGTIVKTDVEGAVVRINQVSDRQPRSHWAQR